jgi:inner membrane protein involved in colicin E2 resistance
MFISLPIISTAFLFQSFKLRLLLSSSKGRLDIKNVFRQRFSLGMVLLLVYGAQLLWGAFIRQRSLLLCGGIVLLLVFCGRTVVRNRDWASRQALIR